MDDLPADRKYCIHCGDEIPNPSAYCPICGKDQESETTYTSKEESEDEPESEASVTKSDGIEITWNDVEGTKTASQVKILRWAILVCSYLIFGITALVILYSMYRVVVGPDVFWTTLPILIFGFLLLLMILGIHKLLVKISPTYRLLSEAE